MDLMSTASAIMSIDVACADRSATSQRLRLVTRLIRMAQAEEIACNMRLEALAAADPVIDPERLNAEATGRSPKAAERAMKRAAAAVALPCFRGRLANGELSAEHLDAFDVAVRSLSKKLRPQLLELEAQFAREGGRLTVEEFRERLAVEVRRIEGDDGASRLRQQRQRTSATSWTDRNGMWCMFGRFDPETALALAEAWRRQTETLFHGEHPTEAPEDPVLRHGFFRAKALAQLILGHGRGSGDPEFIVVCDDQTLRHGRHAASRVECGHGLELPITSLQEIAGRARFVPVILDANGCVIAEGRAVPSLEQLVESLRHPVSLNHGRGRRHASRDQRRALRAMYRRCALPGCDRHVGDCEPHHVDFWEHGGNTDLARLIPLCKHHHDRLHAEGWELELGDDRSLIVRRHGEVIMSTGPPCEQWA